MTLTHRVLLLPAFLLTRPLWVTLFWSTLLTVSSSHWVLSLTFLSTLEATDA